MKPVSLSNLLTALAGNAQMMSNFRFVQLQKSWPSLVGTAVAAHTRPVRLQSGVLTVAVSGAAWAQNLAFERRLLLTKIAAALGEQVPLHDIRFETTGWYIREKASQVVLDTAHPLTTGLSGAPPSAATGPETLSDKLDRLRELARWRARQLPGCTRCRMSAPQGELDRWGMCGSCLVKS